MILYTSSHTTSKLYLRAILTIFAHLSEKITQKRINYVVPDLYTLREADTSWVLELGN